MVNHGQVDLQLRIGAMNNLLSAGLVETAGPTYGSQAIWDAMVSDLQWPAIKGRLDSARVPYKAADPSGTDLIAYNGADW
jgi:hypothetical protein